MAMRSTAVAAVVVLTAGLAGCSSAHDCAGVRTVDQGVAAGQPSARAALGALLRDRPKWLDQQGWRVGSTATKPDESVTFVTDGGDRVEVFRSAKNGRWYLTSYRGCR